jgi:hypothetical protein
MRKTRTIRTADAGRGSGAPLSEQVASTSSRSSPTRVPENVSLAAFARRVTFESVCFSKRNLQARTELVELLGREPRQAITGPPGDQILAMKDHNVGGRNSQVLRCFLDRQLPCHPG